MKFKSNFLISLIVLNCNTVFRTKNIEIISKGKIISKEYSVSFSKIICGNPPGYDWQWADENIRRIIEEFNLTGKIISLKIEKDSSHAVFTSVDTVKPNRIGSEKTCILIEALDERDKENKHLPVFVSPKLLN